MRRTALVVALGIATLTSLTPAISHADSLSEIFRNANAAYYRADYEEAARGYRQLVDLGVVDPDVAYDLATAEARAGHYGEAVQFFERALWLRPGDADARAGLDAARAALGKRRAESQGEAEVDTSPGLSEALFGGLSVDLLAICTLLLELALCCALAALLFVRRESVRLGLGITAPLLGLGLAVSAAGLTLRAGWLDEGQPGVVLEEGTPLREGPDPHATERQRALEGQRAWILSRDRNWLEVRVPSVGQGWVEANQIGRVHPPG